MLQSDKDLHELIVSAKNVSTLIRLARKNGMKLTRAVAARLFVSVHGDTGRTVPADAGEDDSIPSTIPD